MSENDNLIPNKLEIDDPGRAIDTVQTTMDNFMAVADVKRVYGEAIQHEKSTIIPAAEVVAGMGFGAGYGVGNPGDDAIGKGGGGGGGGGGRAFSRPVAVIIADENGVRIEPIADRTKIILTALTAAGFIAATIGKMIRGDVGD
jgi:uncharacterized spore protein YtfJ